MTALGAILLMSALTSSTADIADWRDKEEILDAICGLRPDGDVNSEPALVYMQFEVALENEAGKERVANITPANFRILDSSNRLAGASFDKLQSSVKGMTFWMKPIKLGNIPMAMIMVPDREQESGEGKFGVIVMSESSPQKSGDLLYTGNCALSYLPTGAELMWESYQKKIGLPK